MRQEILAAVLVVLVAGSLGAGYVAGSINQVTTSPVSQATSTYTQTEMLTSTVTKTLTWYNFTEYGLLYLTANPGCSISSSGGPWVPAPCWGSKADAYMFNCAAEAATPQGCSRQIFIKGGGNVSFSVLVWYPPTNDTAWQVWQNCQLSVLPPSGPAGSYYNYCVSLNSTSFLISEPAGPPP